MKMIEGLLRTREQIPKITEQMKQQWIQVIGDEVIAKQRDYHPDNLMAFPVNGEPAFACGTFRAHPYKGPKTWKNAWDQTLVAAQYLRETVSGQSLQKKKKSGDQHEQMEVIGDPWSEIRLIIDSRGPSHSRVHVMIGGESRYPRDTEQAQMWETAFRRFEQEWVMQISKEIVKLPKTEISGRYVLYLGMFKEALKFLVLEPLVSNIKKKKIGGVDVVEALPSKKPDVRVLVTELLKNVKQMWLDSDSERAQELWWS